jgi:ATP-dependent exoDNAse (exonuclease V) alpha subunit
VKGAYTGIAASLIDGKTLHVLGGIPVRGNKQSAQTLKRLREFWRTKRYIIIDEDSMLSRSFFAKLSSVISKATEVENDKVFGGLNVVLVGDFHQFPPVVARRSAPLYFPADVMHDSEDDVLGRKIYEQFTTVVQLKQQIRIQDPIWQDVLQHVRYGNCRQEHINIIKKLIITNPDCPPTDYSKSPWKDARLVTPRHAVRIQWNSTAIKKHCAETHQRLYICPSEDTVGGHPISNEEKIAILTQSKGSKTKSDRGGLTKEIELAIGAPVMVTLNIHTDLDVANGVRGTVEGIVLDERERLITTKETHIIRLCYPPRYVLVKLDRTKAPTLDGLEDNVIPIIPVNKSFTINKDGEKLTVNRRQLPLTLAYAFTDYRSQGQTLVPVIDDIGPPPYGRLTPFNIYVALSRGIGQNDIRLLRDFDETLLQQHPSEYLRLEDERLLKMNEATKKVWEERCHYSKGKE